MGQEATFRTISIRDDIEQVILQLVYAIPEVYLDYDINFVELQLNPEDTNLWDIVFVESEETELVLGEAWFHGDLTVEIEIFGD